RSNWRSTTIPTSTCTNSSPTGTRNSWSPKTRSPAPWRKAIWTKATSLAGITPRISPAVSQGSRWMLPAAEADAVAALSAALGIGPPAAKVLVSRGFRDPAAARRFLNPAFEELHDPLSMRDMAVAVERIARAIARGERILIYGDYDVDGTTSVVLLTKAFELAGGTPAYHVPHRLKDGYGMRSEVVEAAAEQGVKLIVSVDTGIRAAEVVRRAGELGIDVIVTDHHLPETELPPALAVLNPNRPDCPYPEKNLCGAGVAFKLIQALLPSLGWPAEKVRRVAESFLKLAAIATVADVVPLTGENRILVAHGLRGLDKVRNAGLRALLDVAGFTAGPAPPRGLANLRNSCKIRIRTAVRWKRRSATSASRSPSPTPNAGWSTTPRTGIAACSALWPAAWWSACTARFSCWGVMRTMAWRRARDAALRRSTFWKRWSRCPTSSCDSAATRTRPGSPWKWPTSRSFGAASMRSPARGSAPTIFCAGWRSTPCSLSPRSASRPSTRSSPWRRSVTATRRRCSPHWAWKWPRSPPS